MNTQRALLVATKHLQSLSGHIFDLLEVTKPVSPEAAVNLSKVVSKLSPLLGNLIEFNTVEYLNQQNEFHPFGKWIRQDPGFPDAILKGRIDPVPGFEIKAWFPLATEITARFRDSQNHFTSDKTHVCMLAWLPEHLIYGKPYILDVVVVSGLSVAQSRDEHYHNPPGYIVLEPEDTKARTRNLQQTNTAGMKFQGTFAQLEAAKKLVKRWGKDGTRYQPNREYQLLLRTLTAKFPYRLDTNYAKMDRIVHPGIEAFKTKVMTTVVNGMSVRDWVRTLCSGNELVIKESLKKHLQIGEGDVEKLLK